MQAMARRIMSRSQGKGYMTYDFFLPGLIIDALESGDGKHLFDWAKELIEKDIHTVNMLGCHDGIPLLDLKGLLSEERIQNLIDTVVGRGGYVKDLHGQKNMYYQVNATYYSALGEDDAKMLLARALQLFMPENRRSGILICLQERMTMRQSSVPEQADTKRSTVQILPQSRWKRH